MTDAPKMSEAMQALGQAIQGHPHPVQAAICGFDLWIEVMSSPHIRPCTFLKGGTLAKGDEPDTVLKVPVMVIGNNIVISFDPTLAPDGFYLRP